MIVWINIVMIWGLCFATNLVQWIACGMISIINRCAISFPIHLCVNAMRREPKILSWGKGEK